MNAPKLLKLTDKKKKKRLPATRTEDAIPVQTEMSYIEAEETDRIIHELESSIFKYKIMLKISYIEQGKMQLFKWHTRQIKWSQSQP